MKKIICILLALSMCVAVLLTACGETTTESVMYKPRFRFCPWCGAEMRKEKNDGEI